VGGGGGGGGGGGPDRRYRTRGFHDGWFRDIDRHSSRLNETGDQEATPEAEGEEEDERGFGHGARLLSDLTHNAQADALPYVFIK
jgi:hypothetical protein